MKEENLWCAWCGKYGDHQSGWCPEIKRLESQLKLKTIRYFIDIRDSGSKWSNLELVLDEKEAKDKCKEWVDWFAENNKTWFEIKIVKETVIQEVIETYKSNNN